MLISEFFLKYMLSKSFERQQYLLFGLYSLLMSMNIVGSVPAELQGIGTLYQETEREGARKNRKGNAVGSLHLIQKQAPICWPDSEPLPEFCLFGLIPDISAKVADCENIGKEVRPLDHLGVGRNTGVEVSVLPIPGQWECLIKWIPSGYWTT